MPRVVTAGEVMVLLTPPSPGRLRHARALDLRVAGTEGTVAIALARVGVDVGWISRVGDDELGELILARIRAEGVDTRTVSRSTTAATGLYLRDSVPAGVRVFYYRAGSAASELDADACDPSYLDGAEIVHLTGVTPALSPSCARFNAWLAREGRARGARISFDVNFRSRLWPAEAARQSVERFLPAIDLLFVSADDARALWGQADESLVRELAGEDGARDVVMTLGAEGALGVIAGELRESPGVPIVAVDLVGCGDAFAAGYLAGTVWREPPERRLRIANAMGAYNALGHGDYEGLPSRAELLAFMEGRPSGMLR